MQHAPHSFISSGVKRVGIIAGGQLGKMLALAASNLDVSIRVMDGSNTAPASTVCASFVLGDYSNYEDVYAFGKSVDLLTLELEHVNIEALLRLKSEGLEIHPNPSALKIIQDKGLQKQFFKAHTINSSTFTFIDNKNQLIEALAAGKIEFPFVQKSRKFGYDGKGVVVITSADTLSAAFDSPSIVEPLVDIDKEISVIVCRDQLGHISAYDPVEMVFNPEGNLVDLLKCPAGISTSCKEQAVEIAKKLVETFDIIGVLAVEFFLDNQGTLWVNEVAPRPHNSGHHTIETTLTSQFEQHMRAILGFTLGSTKMLSPSVMLNLLGDKAHQGNVQYKGIEACFEVEGAKFHIYGKKHTKPLRKMGHVTILDASIDKAMEKAIFIKKNLKIISA